MRRLLLALPFALLPLAVAHAAEEHDHDHGADTAALALMSTVSGVWT